jgi:anti-anti-sigma regulatory factor
MMEEVFEIKSRIVEEIVTIIDFPEQLTEENCWTLQNTVDSHLNNGNLLLVFNLADLKRFDALGIGEIVSVAARIKARGGILCALNLPKFFQNQLLNEKVTPPFSICTSEIEAVEYLKGKSFVISELHNG